MGAQRLPSALFFREFDTFHLPCYRFLTKRVDSCRTLLIGLWSGVAFKNHKTEQHNRKESSMHRIRIITSIAMSLTGSGLVSLAQTPGSIVGVGAHVNGTLTATSTRPGGCPTIICTTNVVTFSKCYTNEIWERICTTNDAGAVQCTNVLVPVVRCFTNTFPEITCTNEVLNPVTVSAEATFTGPLTSTPCDEIDFPSNAVFQAVLFLNLRTNDWVGTQFGSFKILDGTNVIASGSMTGVDGLSTHSPGPCAVCNHFEGTLRGLLRASSPLHGAILQATYSADITGASCPLSMVPQGATVMVIQGVATSPCPFALQPFSAFGGP
jgi:hypothetical protein